MPFNINVARNRDNKGIGYGVILSKSDQLETMNTLCNEYTNGDKKDNYIQQATFQCIKSEKIFTLVNTHVKFGKIDQLIATVKQIDGLCIVTGDFNVGFRDPRPESSPNLLLQEKKFILWTKHSGYSHVNYLGKLDLFDHFYSTRDEIILHPDLDLVTKLREGLTCNLIK